MVGWWRWGREGEEFGGEPRGRVMSGSVPERFEHRPPYNSRYRHRGLVDGE